MPTYVYECGQCEEVFEVEQRISEAPLEHCSCGAKGSVKRLIQPTAVLFKGQGFHVNDYTSKPAPVPCEKADAGSPACEACPAPKS